jgi:hypothetical protein
LIERELIRRQEFERHLIERKQKDRREIRRSFEFFKLLDSAARYSAFEEYRLLKTGMASNWSSS